LLQCRSLSVRLCDCLCVCLDHKQGRIEFPENHISDIGGKKKNVNSVTYRATDRS